MAKTQAPAIVSLPAFPGRALVKAQAAYDTASVKLGNKHASALGVLFNSWLDQCRAAGLDRSETGTKALRAAILDQDDVARAIREGLWTRDTIGNYAQGAMRAFYHGAEWSPRAFQAEDKGGLPALPWSKKAGKANDKANDERVPRPPITKQTNNTTPTDEISGPVDALGARKFIRGQMNTLVAYGNKHAKMLDLTTRDVLKQIARLISTIDKIDEAPM